MGERGNTIETMGEIAAVVQRQTSSKVSGLLPSREPIGVFRRIGLRPFVMHVCRNGVSPVRYVWDSSVDRFQWSQSNCVGQTQPNNGLRLLVRQSTVDTLVLTCMCDSSVTLTGKAAVTRAHGSWPDPMRALLE